MRKHWIKIVGVIAGLVVVGLFFLNSISDAAKRRTWYDTGPAPGAPLTPAVGPVVDNPAPNHDTPAFRISQRPTMVVGRIKDDLRNELWAIRDALLTQTGKLALINPVDELRLFDTNGTVLWTKRGRGQGPGAIESAAQLANFRGDTLYLFDQRLRRVTVLDENAGVVRTKNLASSNAVCCLADGSVLVRPREELNYRPLANVPEHVTWSSLSTERPRTGAAEIVIAPENEIPHPAGSVGGRDIFTVRGSDPSISIGPLREYHKDMSGHLLATGRSRPFARSAIVRAAGNAIIYARSDSLEYRVYSPTGELIRIVRSTVTPVPVTAGDLEAARVVFMDADYSAKTMRIFASTFERLEHPATMPAFGRVSAEQDGTV